MAVAQSITVLFPLLLLVLRGYAMPVGSERVDTVYLGGHQRFSEGNKWDFYFCCNVQGPNMQWTINGSDYGLFLPEELQQVRRESLPNFNYTTTLLSSRTTEAGVYQLDSVMIVSVADDIALNVGCVSDTGSDLASNREISTNQLKQLQFPMIRIVQLWAGTIIQGGGTSTTCLLCEVDYSTQFWETNNGDSLGFDSYSDIGSESSLLSTDESFLRLQTILIDQPPQRLVSILLLSDSSVSNVTCFANGYSLNSAHLRSVPDTSDIIDVTTPDVTTSDVATAIVDTKHTFETATEDHTQPSSDQTILRDTSMGSISVTIAISVILSALFIAAVMAVAILLIVRVMCWKNSQSKDKSLPGSVIEPQVESQPRDFRESKEKYDIPDCNEHLSHQRHEHKHCKEKRAWHNK